MLRTPEIIKKQIEELDSIIENTEKVMKENYEYVHSETIEFLLEQDYEQRKKLMDELTQSLVYYQQHTSTILANKKTEIGK